MPKTYTAPAPPPEGTDTFTLGVSLRSGGTRSETFTYKTGRSYGDQQRDLAAARTSDLAYFRGALVDEAEYDRFVAFVQDPDVYVDGPTIGEVAKGIAESSTAPHPTGPPPASRTTTRRAGPGSRAGRPR